MPKPRSPAPALSVDTVGGGHWSLADHETWTMMVRGDDLARAKQAKRERKLDNLMAGYGISVETMREWGLFISKGISNDEPDLFPEPGLFVTKPDGSIYYVAVNSITFGRPRMSEMLKALEMKISQYSPGRGEV